MTRTIVGVLRGGTSSEYALSLKTGAAVLSALPEDVYDVRDILIDKQGHWYLHGMPSTPLRALAQLDVVVPALHGGVGEDGTVHRILEGAGVPYAGSSPLSTGLALNKIRARQILRQAGLRVPRGVAFAHTPTMTTGEMARHVFSRIGPPYIVKPPRDGAGYGVRYAAALSDLPDAIGDVIDESGTALVEEYVRGEEASVGIIHDFREEPFYALPPAQVVRDGRHLTRDHHESGTMRHIVPSGFSYGQKQTLADLARTAHKVLGLHHYSRSDLIVSSHGVYLLEVNSTPGLYPGASFPKMLEAVGSSIREFVEHIIALARTR